MNNTKILLVDDDKAVLQALCILFKDEYITLEASSGEEAIQLFENEKSIACVVMDIKMPGMGGIVAGRHIRQINENIAIIFHTGHPGDYDEDTIDEMEKPYDYIQKGNSITKLQRTVRNAVDSFLLQTKQYHNENQTDYGMVGSSFAMKNVYNFIGKVTGKDTKVMILGETGTGKEMVARAIHNHSSRAENKLAILNCNHKSADLIESELFGHLKGSFTGAVSDRVGLFEYANNGTILLDEIGDLDITTQAKLLRVLETGEYNPIGMPERKLTNVRLICATHKDLESLVKENKFREDLFFRLKGVTIQMPPLREHKEDIPELIEYYLDKLHVEKGFPLKVFDISAINLLIECEWPGNVRQLLDTVESILVLTESDLIIDKDVKTFFDCDTLYEYNREEKGLSSKLKVIERTLIIEALNEADNNISKAAQLLEMDRSNLYKKIKYYNLL